MCPSLPVSYTHLLLTLAGCGKKDMDYTMQNESSVAESVRETGEESVLIQNEDAGEGENAAPETKYKMCIRDRIIS